MNSITSSPFIIFEAILLSLILVMGMAQFSIRLARRVNLIDLPDSAPHKQHFRPTPLAGGIALLLTLILAELIFGTFGDLNIRVTFLAAGLIFVFGLWDDYKNSSPLVKFTGQFIAALLLIRMGVYIRIFESPEFFLRGNGIINVYLDWILTVFWVVGITNAFNFVDSMDGLAVGLGGMAAAFFMLVTLDAQQPVLSLHSALIVGACIGLYYFNSPPALLFLGDSGAQTLGFVLAVLAIAYSPQGANQSSSWFVPIILLGVPIFDAFLVVVSRLRRGKPVYFAARDHTYHRLLNLGFESTRAVLVMQVVGLALGCLAFVILTQPPLIANLVFVGVLIVGIAALTYLEHGKNCL
jgi:UDP-GlcNAc:undecaprenyl-phosphate/decaprenyl-phosphate GlcNAc-1-phosphate transferase